MECAKSGQKHMIRDDKNSVRRTQEILDTSTGPRSQRTEAAEGRTYIEGGGMTETVPPKFKVDGHVRFRSHQAHGQGEKSCANWPGVIQQDNGDRTYIIDK